MSIALSVICADWSCCAVFPQHRPIAVGTEADADLCIPWVSQPFCITFDHTGGSIRMESGEIRLVQMNEFHVLDSASRLTVFFTENNAAEQSYILPETCEIYIGRSDKVRADGRQNHIQINLPFISGFHCSLTRQNGVVSVRDDGSKNGLFLNGRSVRQTQMRDGDVLTILTVRIILKGNQLRFENVGDRLTLRQVWIPPQERPAPRKALSPKDFVCNISPRLMSQIDEETIRLESPPQKNGTPQINWLSVLGGPAASIALSALMTISSGGDMSGGMMLLSAAMTSASAVTAVVSYRQQKKKSAGDGERIDQKYQAYLKGISERVQRAKQTQRGLLEDDYPSPAECVSIARNRSRTLWNRSMEDADFLAVRLGIGTIASKVTAVYPQSELQLEENDLEKQAKALAESSSRIDAAPIVCGVAGCIGVIGKRMEVIQLARNMIVSLAAAHSYHDVKMIALVPAGELSDWDWIRWLPHCGDVRRKDRYVFSNPDEAEETLDEIYDVLSKRDSGDDSGFRKMPAKEKPHYVFIAADTQILEKHPIRKHILGSGQNGCSALFCCDRLSRLPKECHSIIELDGGRGKVYSRSDVTDKQAFAVDAFTIGQADAFARSLAPLCTQAEGAASVLPQKISFLEGCGVSRPEQLDLGARWSNAKPYRSLAVPVAAKDGGEIFEFDIHEKHHGVNGIVAGMPGSGKTEMVQSWLLSLAVNFPPQDVSFVLIDFKGTGMIAPFRDLPHLAGSISNLDTNINRNLVAIRSEVHRREAILDRYSSFNIKNVNDLNKAYRNGLVPERLPILMIVIDEYAEFKKNYPDFGTEIDSLTSKGRALGMFVVLMTQKPAGVVSAKSEDNIKFRWCLRVANYGASREMLGKPDAAKINNPGRAFIKVGEDDVYEQVQSFWSGAPYEPDRKNTKQDPICTVAYNGKRTIVEQMPREEKVRGNESEIDVVVRHIARYCKEAGIAPAGRIWTEKLPERITLPELLTSGFDGRRWPVGTGGAVIGLVDDPASQRQYPLALDLGNTGHIMVYGAPVTGKTTLLQTLVMSLAMSNTPEQTHIYMMDFGGWNLSVLRGLPHVGGIANDQEPERLKKLTVLINDILEERKATFSRMCVGNIDAYREATGEKIADIILIVDNIGAALKLYPDLDAFFSLVTGAGSNYGIYLVATAAGTNVVPIRISQNIKFALALQMIEKSDYTYTVGKVADMLPAVPGRGYMKNSPPLEFQTALPASGEQDKIISDQMRSIAEQMDRCWDGDRPQVIPEMPDVIAYGSVKTKDVCLGLSVQRVEPVTFSPEMQHFLLISGMAGSGKSSFLSMLCRQMKQRTDAAVYLFDLNQKNPAAGFADACLSSAAEADAFIEQLRPELQKRQMQRQSGGAVEFRPMVLAVDDYPCFFRAVSNDTIARLLAIIKIGEGLGVYLMMAGDAYEMASLINKGEAVALSAARAQISVMLGGCMNDHAGIAVKAAHTLKSTAVKDHEGYHIHGNTYTHFKAMHDGGDVAR